MFKKPDIHAQIWKTQRNGHGPAKVKGWKLLESCGVQIITFTSSQLILLVERKYPLTRFTLDQMLNAVRIEVKEESEVSLELLRNKSMKNNEYDDTRVVEDGPVVKIKENTSMMDEGGIEDGEIVDEDGGVVSDKSAHDEIDIQKNKGVFGCADKESDDCNIVFGSMSRNDMVSNVNKRNNESFAKSYARAAERIELNKNLFSIPTSIKENMDEVAIFDEEIVKKKWSLDVCVEKAEPDRIPVWVKLFNIPLEAWSVKGISALASRLGKPLVMDDMTANMCHNGIGRSAFVRVLMEIKADKGFKDLTEIKYKDKSNNVIRTKFVKVEFSWKPISCSHCNVFRYSDSRCYKNGTKKDQMENDKGTKVHHDNKGFVEVRHKRYGFYRADKRKEQAKESTTINERGEVNTKENEAIKNLVADELDGGYRGIA
nr:hypothetical protein [Tanacetum cinerariifolium]